MSPSHLIAEVLENLKSLSFLEPHFGVADLPSVGKDGLGAERGSHENQSRSAAEPA